MKDFKLWNKATIAKLVWAIQLKKDTLWVRWIHSRYIKTKEWWEFTPCPDSSWYWKKVCQIKEELRHASNQQQVLDWKEGRPYKVTQGYLWQLQLIDKVPWANFIWSRANIPSHAFISWVFIQGRLPTMSRLARFHPQ